ncbi:MAG: hypothetical protein ACTH7N_16560, partial [Brevibacterium aurantiacum]
MITASFGSAPLLSYSLLDITNTVIELPARSIRSFPSSPMPPVACGELEPPDGLAPADAEVKCTHLRNTVRFNLNNCY